MEDQLLRVGQAASQRQARVRACAYTQIRCLNEEVAGSCRNVFRAWEKRLEPADPPLRSNEDDPELLLHVP